MTKSWLDQKERGSLSLMYVIMWLTLNVGYSVGWFLLPPICLYFVCFVPKGRLASKEYLKIVFQRDAKLSEVYYHFHVFSATILDRLFFVSGKLDNYKITIEGEELFDALLAQKKGAILLGAHLGSFEVLRCLAERRPDIKLKVMMYVENAKSTGAIFHHLNPDLAHMVIPLGQPDSILKAKEFLDEGGFIGILGDRITKGDKIAEIDFLGQKADFPLGPHILSSVLAVPSIFFCGLYYDKRRYQIYFEKLAQPQKVARKDRDVYLRGRVEQYATLLEKYTKLQPYNWFNFFKFWA